MPDLTSKPFNTLNEKPLHAALKRWYAQPGDRFEALVDGYYIDLVRDGLLVEFQTGSLGKLKKKFDTLLRAGHCVRLVHPLALEKWIVRLDETGEKNIGRRKSPRRGRLEDLFIELVRLPGLLAHENFSFEVVLIQEEEARRPKPGLSWRRKGWGKHERRLLEVVGRAIFETPRQLAGLLAVGLADPFTTADLARANSLPPWLAGKMAYTLRAMGAIEQIGKRRNAFLYARPGWVAPVEEAPPAWPKKPRKKKTAEPKET